jgi:DNA-binding GntR family transcriptional regulator
MGTVNHMDIEPMVPMTLADQVRQRLRDWIVSGRLKPGDRLRIQELARKLKVSDTTIREALSRLRQTGLVQSVSWAGTRVMEFTRTDMEEVFDLRKALEPFAVRCGGLHIPEQELHLLKDQIRSAEDALGRGEPGRAIAVSNELHA